jgi:nitrate/nitrite transport system substrate-binding protein
MDKTSHRHSFQGGLCGCGQRHSGQTEDGETAVTAAIEQSLLHGLFPDPVLRRTLIKSVGAATLLGALATLLPLDALKAIAQENKPLEKTKLNVGFLPITCAAPLIYGETLGHYAKQGLDVSLQKIAGIGIIRDKMINGELDVSQQVMPVALTMSVGLGGTTQSIKVLTICNQNGNSLVLANKHKDNRDPKNWKGFVFAVPFEQSHQAMQLRNYVAAHGLDPDKDITYRVIPPTEYVSSLRVGNIDGFFGGEPGGQRAVYEGAGFIHALSRDLWDGHPCCSVTAAESWIKQNPNTFMAFYRAAVSQRTRDRGRPGADRALCGWARKHQNRGQPRRLPAVPALCGSRLAHGSTAALEHVEGGRGLQESCPAGDARNRCRKDHAGDGGNPAGRGFRQRNDSGSGV